MLTDLKANSYCFCCTDVIQKQLAKVGWPLPDPMHELESCAKGSPHFYTFKHILEYQMP